MSGCPLWTLGWPPRVRVAGVAVLALCVSGLVFR